MVTDLQWADYVVWSPSELFFEQVKHDEALLTSMRPKLEQFYQQHFLPALLLPHKVCPWPQELQCVRQKDWTVINAFICS